MCPAVWKCENCLLHMFKTRFPLVPMPETLRKNMLGSVGAECVSPNQNQNQNQQNQMKRTRIRTNIQNVIIDVCNAAYSGIDTEYRANIINTEILMMQYQTIHFKLHFIYH